MNLLNNIQERLKRCLPPQIYNNYDTLKIEQELESLWQQFNAQTEQMNKTKQPFY